MSVRRILTDNGAAFRSRDFAVACARLSITYKVTRAYRPQTDSKAEHFIQSALPVGSTTTTGTALMPVSLASRLWGDFPPQDTTS